MSLTRNGKRIGMAAWAEKRDYRDYLDSQKPSTLTDLERARIELNVKTGFYNSMKGFHGENHATTIRAKQDMEDVQKKVASLEGEGVTPVIGYVQDNSINWKTDEIPATYTAVWDDSPDSVTFVKNNRPA